LLGHVRLELGAARIAGLGPLLEELRDLDETEQRPWLILVVQNLPLDEETQKKLEILYEYWQDASDSGACMAT
jgi:hypothetical protein